MLLSVDRFVSNFTSRLDAKGRLSIPAPFRSVLSRDGMAGLYIHPSLDWPALDCGGRALLDSIEEFIAPLSPFGDDRDAMAMTLLGEGDILKMDNEGRIALTGPLKDHAGITSEVSLVGVGHKFQIWETSRFRARLAEARDQARALRTRLGTRAAGAPLTPPGPEARE